MEKNDGLEWKDNFIEINGIKIHYLRTGGKKPHMLMLHGMSDNGACWSRVARELEKDYDIIMVDQRGHGKTVVKETDFSIEMLADDAAALIDGLGLEKPVVIGHSMGGQATTYLASKYPEKVSKAILEDPAYFLNFFYKFGIRLLLPFFLRNGRKDGNKTVEALKEKCKKNDPNWVDEDVEPWAISKQQFGLNLQNGKLGKVKVLVDWKKLIPKIECPTLMIIPSTGVLSIGRARKLSPFFKDCEIEYIENSGHSVRRDQYEKYIQAIKQFLLKK